MPIGVSASLRESKVFDDPKMVTELHAQQDGSYPIVAEEEADFEIAAKADLNVAMELRRWAAH